MSTPIKRSPMLPEDEAHALISPVKLGSHRWVDALEVMRTAIGSSTFWWAVVFLTFAIAPTRVVGQSSASSPPGCVTIYRYDVHVAVHFDAAMSKGVDKIVSDWQARLTAPISVDKCQAGVVKIRTTPGPGAVGTSANVPLYTVTGGEFDVTYTRTDTHFMGKTPVVPPCTYTVTGHSPASLSLAFKNGVPTQFDLWVLGDRRALTNEFLAALKQNCINNRWGDLVVSATFRYPEPTEGISTQSGELTFRGHFFTPPTTTLEARIISALTSGEGFNIDTGMQVVQKTNGDVARSSAAVSFIPLGRGPPPDFPTKPSCQDQTMVNFDIEKNRKMRDIKTEQMKTLSKSYQDAMNKAQSHLQQFTTAARMCGIQTGAKDALLTALALFAPGGEAAIVAEGPAEAAEIAEAVESLEALLPQVKDPAGTIFNIISSLENNEDPTPKMIPYELYQQYLEALEAAKAMSVQINGDQVTKAEAQLDGCAGTIGLSNENWQGANKYVEDLKDGMAMLPQIQSLTNDIRQLDAAYEDLQAQAYAACVKNAACLNQPASSCDKLKPAGNWAKPQ